MDDALATGRARRAYQCRRALAIEPASPATQLTTAIHAGQRQRERGFVACIELNRGDRRAPPPCGRARRKRS